MGRTYDLLVRASSDTRAAQRDLKKLQGASRNLSRAVGVDFGRMAKMGALALGVGLAASVKVGVDELMEAQKVSAQTAAAIASTGGAANVTAKQVGKLAENLSAMSGVDDELIQQSENLLMTFTNIHNEAGKGNDIFTQTTKAALDMSVALGKDLQGSAMAVGKALNDPIKGVVALRRVGVQLTDAQEKQIKKFMKLGDTMSAQKIILRELNKEFGGSAAAQGQTAVGAVGRLKNAYAELSAELLTQVAPSLQGVASGMLKSVNSVRAWSQTADGQRSIDMVRIAIQSLGSIVGSTARFLFQHRTAVAMLAAAYAGSQIASYIGGIVSAMRTFTAAAKAAAASQGLLNAVMLANPYVLVGAAIGALAAGIGLLILKEQAKQREFAKSAAKARDEVRALYSLADAQRDVSGSKLGVREANLAVERAEVTYRQAVKDSGKGSLEAREAAAGLARARMSQKDAVNAATAAERKAHQAATVGFSNAVRAQADLRKEAELTKQLADLTGGATLAEVKAAPKRQQYRTKEVMAVRRQLTQLAGAHKSNVATVAEAERKGWTKRNQFNASSEAARIRSVKRNGVIAKKAVEDSTNVAPKTFKFTNGLKAFFTGMMNTTNREGGKVSAKVKEIPNFAPNFTKFVSGLQAGLRSAAANSGAEAAGRSVAQQFEAGWMGSISDFAARAAAAAAAAVDRAQAAAEAAGQRRKGKASPFATMGVSLFGALLGTNATAGSVTEYARLASGSVYEQNADGSVSTNADVKKFVLKRLAAERARLAKMLSLRKAQIGRLKGLREAKIAASIMVRKARGKFRDKAIAKLAKATAALDTCLGLIDYYSNEAMMLGGAIVADEEMLEPPAPSESTATDTTSTTTDTTESTGAIIGDGTTSQWNTDNSMRRKTGITAAGPQVVQHIYPQSQDVESIARRVAFLISSGKVTLKPGIA